MCKHNHATTQPHNHNKKFLLTKTPLKISVNIFFFFLQTHKSASRLSAPVYKPTGYNVLSDTSPAKRGRLDNGKYYFLYPVCVVHISPPKPTLMFYDCRTAEFENAFGIIQFFWMSPIRF